MEEILELKNVTILAKTKNGESPIIQDVNFLVHAGEDLAIVGESGCGKTMTAMTIFGLLPPNCHATGKVLLSGENLLELNQKELNLLRGKAVVFIPQNGSEFLNPVLKIRYQMFETLKANGIKSKKERNATAIHLLEQVGFEDPEAVLNKYAFQLSGGMAQRVILAIGLSSSPKLVIADEPTRGVDDKNAHLFLDQLDKVFEHSAVVIITHSIDIAKRCKKLLVMYAGLVMEYGEAQIILNHTTHPYTQSLINALPAHGFQVYKDKDHKLIHINGCPFYGQCPKSIEKCANQIPELNKMNTGWRRCYVD